MDAKANATATRRMRIAQMATDFGMGGIARHSTDLGAWLAAQGHEVFFAGTEGEWANPRSHAGFLDIPTRGVAAGGGALPRRLANTLGAAFGLRRWLRRMRIDVIHAHESAPGLVALVARAGLGIPLVVTYHGSEPGRVRGFGAIARHADVVVTPSFRAGEALVAEGGVPRDRVRVIGLGIRPAPADNAEDVARLRAELLGDGTRLVVSLARVAYQKGIDILIDCVARLKQTDPGIRFVVVGDGPLDAEMRALAASRGVTSHLTFAGRSETPFRYLRAADLMLLTSRWEALPISIVESFQVGTPVVATDCSGVHQLVDDSVGACVPVGDVAAISDAVARIVTDDALRARMSLAARARAAEDRFDPDAINRQFEALYAGLLAR